MHTPWHAKAARRYFDEWSNRSKYTEEERAYIDCRIDEALKKFERESGTKAKSKRVPPTISLRKKVEELSLKQLLQLFLGTARLRRATEIKDSLVSIREAGADKINGKVKDYVVQIDVKNRRILHDCEDWRKNMASKNMCKHLGKFLLSLDEKRATDLLRNIIKKKEEWTFVAP